MKKILEVAMVSRPHTILSCGEVAELPLPGDFISFAKHDHEPRETRTWWGYVRTGRRVTYEENGDMRVRVWLQADPQ